MMEHVMIFGVILDQNGPNWGPFGIHPYGPKPEQDKNGKLLQQIGVAFHM